MSQRRSHRAYGHIFQSVQDLSAVTGTQGIPSHRGFHLQTRTHSLQDQAHRPPPSFKTEATKYAERDITGHALPL